MLASTYMLASIYLCLRCSCAAAALQLRCSCAALASSILCCRVVYIVIHDMRCSCAAAALQLRCSCAAAALQLRCSCDDDGVDSAFAALRCSYSMYFACIYLCLRVHTCLRVYTYACAAAALQLRCSCAAAALHLRVVYYAVAWFI